MTTELAELEPIQPAGGGVEGDDQGRSGGAAAPASPSVLRSAVPVFLRFALGAALLSAVADRFGLWGPPGAAGVAWGDFARFLDYAGTLSDGGAPLSAAFPTGHSTRMRATTTMQSRNSPRPPERCRNCGDALTGRFCSACGQEAVRDRTFGELVQAFVGDLFEVDSRALRTLRLLLRPGALSAEWRAGRRVRYLPPTRLYLVASVLFFFVVALGPNVVEIRAPTDAERALLEETAGSDQARSFGEKIVLASRNEDRINDLFLQAFAWTMFVLVPVFALLLRGLFRGGDLLYAHHFVFALHYHAFGFLTMAAGLAAAQLPWLGGAAVVAAVVAPHVINAGYLLLALRRFYGSGWAGTVGRAAAFGFGYILALAAGAGGTLAVLILAIY